MDVDKIVDCLLNGGVVLYPTDTVYGLAASPLHECAVNKIFDLKLRPKDRFLPIMVSKASDLEVLGIDINTNATKLFESHLVPGAITIVLGFKTEPAVSWLKGRDEVAIRIPDEPAFLKVLDKTGPLLVTSANKHSIPKTPTFVGEILQQLNGTPDLVFDGGECREIPSTIINCHANPPRIERQGSVPAEEIFKILNDE